MSLSGAGVVCDEGMGKRRGGVVRVWVWWWWAEEGRDGVERRQESCMEGGMDTKVHTKHGGCWTSWSGVLHSFAC